MKKVFILFICCFFIKVNAATTTANFEVTFIGSYHYVDSNGKYGDFEKFIRKSDGTIAYCIEPGIPLSLEDYIGYYGNSEELLKVINITQEKLEKISLIAYFGYGYANHNSVEWIVATQSLIWQELGRVFWFTSRNNKDNPQANIIDIPQSIQSNMTEITDLVENYLKVPIINNNDILLGDNQVFSDEAFINYEVLDCENCTALLDGINLTVTPLNSSDGKVILQKKYEAYNEDFIIYNHNSGQDVIVPGKGLNHKLEIHYKVNTGKLTIYKYDKDNRKCEPKIGGSLAGTIFKLYKNTNEFVTDIVIDENCMGVVDGLAKGRYRFYEEQAGKGYEWELNNYYFEVRGNYLVFNYKIYNKRYVGQIKLAKIDKDSQMCTNEGFNVKGAVYGIYDINNNLIQKLILDEECKAFSERSLEIGKYYVMELEAPKGYKLDFEKHYFEITKENADDVIEMQLEDELYKTDLIINKMYLIDNNLVPEVGAVFGIYDNQSKEKVTDLIIDETGRAQITLKYGEYIIKQETGKEGYKKAEDFLLIVNESTEKETIITILNEKFKVNLIINKVDEDGNIIKQKGFKFKLYNLQNDKYICYKNLYLSNEEICDYQTNENGQLFFPVALDKGTYRLEELDSFIPGYVWNKEGLVFEINDSTFYEIAKDGNMYFKLNFVNEKVKGKIQILKYAKDSNIPLKDALFKIYKEDGTLYKEARTDKEGIIYLDNLPYGKYYLIEKQAPQGYLIKNDPIWFEIIDNDLIKINIENEAIVVPETYIRVNYFGLIGSLIILILGIFKYGKKSN